MQSGRERVTHKERRKMWDGLENEYLVWLQQTVKTPIQTFIESFTQHTLNAGWSC